MNWNEIEGFDAWAETLDGLLAELGKALEAKNQAQKDAALEDLRDFMKYSPNEIARPLDDLALAAVLNATTKSWTDAAADLATRTAELSKLTKHVKAVTESNVKATEALRMTAVRTVIDKATDSIKAFGDLKSQLEGAQDADAVIAKIDAAIKAVQGLRNAAEQL